MLQVLGVTKSYDGKTLALAGVDLAVPAGEIVALLGPSGCGKTTLLRIVAGLEQPDQGRVLLEGADLLGLPVHRRNFGLMFQEFALFPHRTVFENVAFGLRMAAGDQRPSAAQINRRVAEMLELVNLAGYGDRSIFALSGGERQRVALARSLAPNPRLLMLDEPLGSLDRALREELMSELRVILKGVGVTALYVTHDQQEALAVADRIVVMNRGRIEQVGAPPQVYAQPANEFVARFLGFQNLLPAVVDWARSELITTPLGQFLLAEDAPKGPDNRPLLLLIRPQAALRIEPHQDDLPGDGVNRLYGVVQSVSFRGDYQRIAVEVSGDDGSRVFVFHLTDWGQLDQTLLRRGEDVRLTVDATRLTLVPGVTPARP
jgi:ABC-type Fe3+/spermidine/putrescine transport system ATPase subunit